jgi:thiamine kinase-like enzyme
VAQLTAFMRELKHIEADAETRSLGDAAEAFFTPNGVLANIEQRYAALDALDERGSPYDALRRFLDDEFLPALHALSARATVIGSHELPWEFRMLSPSDLGFHNALRRSDGGLVFLDFEYFGWDDPAKTLSDCLLHPMMRLAPERRMQLASEFNQIFCTDPDWRTRVNALYPLFALKWCMIMLNEFRPEQIERRRYVDRDAEEVEAIQMRQLYSARALLERIRQQEGEFPYWGPEA